MQASGENIGYSILQSSILSTKNNTLWSKCYPKDSIMSVWEKGAVEGVSTLHV